MKKKGIFIKELQIFTHTNWITLATIGLFIYFHKIGKIGYVFISYFQTTQCINIFLGENLDLPIINFIVRIIPPLSIYSIVF
jgi:hypothetical protein